MSVSSPSSPRQSTRWPWLILLLLIVALLVWWFWPGRSAGQNPQSFAGGFDEAVPVRVASVRQGDFPIDLKALGTVTALNTASVRARVDGLLTEVSFEEGEWAKQGDVLAVIDPRPYEVALQQAQGTLQENRAQLKNAQIDLQRYRGLFAEDSIARQTLDTQEALVAQYQGTIKANEASLNEARLNLQFTRIRAPISGRLGLRQVDVGNLVASGDTTPLVTITETRPISIAFTLPETDLSQLQRARAKDSEALAVEAWNRDDSERLASGKLQSVDNQIDLTTGTVKLKARFENSDELLFPNQFVNVRLRVAVRPQALLVPSDAIQYGSIGTYGYVVAGDDTVSVRKLEVGPANDGTTLVESGVEPNERLVVEGFDRLREGAKVEIIEGDDPAAIPAPLQKHDA